MRRQWISLIAPLALAACAGTPSGPRQPPPSLQTAAFMVPDRLPPPTQCALFAREFTGIHIRGDAWSWWQLAAGIYPRSDAPHPGVVLVLRSTAQLPLGHVGIVKRVVGPREITITHANWGTDDPTKRIVHDHTAVIDVSPRNDWTELRFWNAPAHAFGKVYQAYGFIYPHSFDADGDGVW